MKKLLLLLTAILLVCALVAACGNSNDGQNPGSDTVEYPDPAPPPLASPAEPLEQESNPRGIAYDAPRIRLSESLYTTASVTDWEPYFTGEEPVWRYNPEQPWATWEQGEERSRDQDVGVSAYIALNTFLEGHPNFAGFYVNIEGFLTVMMVNPTYEIVEQIKEKSPYPVWIIAAEFSYDILRRAQNESFSAITSWIEENPDIAVSMSTAYTATIENRVRINLQGSGVPTLLDALEFPDFIEFAYTPTVDASLPHDIPRSPNTVWERDGVTIRSVRESYPVGTTFLLITGSHNVEGMRLFAPYSPMRVEKYVDGEWFDLSGDFFTPGIYTEIFDIPASEEKTIQISIVTPETLGPGLYRANFRSFASLAENDMNLFNNAIVGREPGDHIIIEFIVTHDAEPLPPREAVWYWLGN